MATAEGTFPKLGGDPPYASEYNEFMEFPSIVASGNNQTFGITNGSNHVIALVKGDASYTNAGGDDYRSWGGSLLIDGAKVDVFNKHEFVYSSHVNTHSFSMMAYGFFSSGTNSHAIGVSGPGLANVKLAVIELGRTF